MARVSSDLGAATDAVSLFKLSQQSGQQFTLGESNIAGMRRATELSNQIIEHLSQLEEGIKAQADKFPQLAAVMEERDQRDASDLSQMNWGF